MRLEHGIDAIDMLVVNLYPFAETIAKPDCSIDDAIENIDIGGPAMVRAAAKNHERVAVLEIRRHVPGHRVPGGRHADPRRRGQVDGREQRADARRRRVLQRPDPVAGVRADRPRPQPGRVVLKPVTSQRRCINCLRQRECERPRPGWCGGCTALPIRLPV